MIRLFRYLKPYRGLIVVVLILAFLQSLANLYLPTLMADIVDTGIVQGDTNYIMRVGGLMLLITLGGVVCAIFGAFFAARISVGFGRDVRRRLFTHVEKFSLHEFDAISTASLITRTTNDTNQVQMVLVIMLTMMVTAPMMAIGGVIMALSQDTTLAQVVRDLLGGGVCPTLESFYRLRSAGLIVGDSPQSVRFRCLLYARYLEAHLQ